MIRIHKLVPVFAALAFLPLPALRAEEPVDLAMVTRIRDEGFRRSQVMETLTSLTTEVGPRLTGSPQAKEANEWTKKTLEGWGLVNAHLEAYPFGRGWSFSRAAVRMTAPREVPLAALPKAWTPGTDGPVRGAALRVDLKEEKDFEKHKGKLAGKILLLDPPRPAEDVDPADPQFKRLTAEELDGLLDFELPDDRDRFEGGRSGRLKRYNFRRAVHDFLVAEKVAAIVEISSWGQGIVRVGGGGSNEPGENVGVPAVVMASEPYNQIVHRLDEGQEVELEVDVAARFHDEDPNSYNTIAEIPGTDKRDQVVMLGAHLDSWHGGTGATDNGAGVAVVMEAVRILKALGVKPRRTIRVALWTGEEQGLLGSVAYVKEHFATRPETTDPEQKKLPERMREETWPLKLKPEHAKLAAYFNMDNGTGKFRGIYAEENAAVVPIFKAWLEPLSDLGADRVTLRKTGGTDHVAMDRVGLPGFQFIQDPMDYFTLTHHTNLDTLDHARRKDLMQASVVMATFVYHAAMRDQPLPRKPVPQKPVEKKKTKKDEEKKEEE